jgi:hypothetical protein
MRFDSAPRDLEDCPDLVGERIDYRVNGPSCAPHGAMRDILCRNRSVPSHVSRGANRPSLSAANANSEGEND